MEASPATRPSPRLVRRAQRRFERSLSSWRRALDGCSDAALMAPGDNDAWGPGQVCHHAFLTSGLFLDQAEACARGDGERRRGSLLPIVLTTLGRFPPGRIKVPDGLPESWRVIGSPDPIDRDTAIRCLDALAVRTRSLEADCAAASSDVRRKHPVAGWMNAAQWLALSEIHFRHHLKQVSRHSGQVGSV